MKLLGIAIVIVLTVALAVAVGWVVFHVGRIVFRIICDARATRRSPRQSQHPEFGALTFESGLWRGEVTRDGITIPFTVAGTGAAPDADLLNRLRDVVRRFRDIQTEGLAFLKSEVVEMKAANFTLYGLEFLWPKDPDVYSLEWLAEGDDSRVWRVNFEADKPKEVGFDD